MRESAIPAGLGARRKAAWAIVLAKIAASTLMLAATLGWLWHNGNAPDLWPNVKPPVLYALASGWYKPVYMLARWFYSQAALKGLIYAGVCFGAVLALYTTPFIRSNVVRTIVSLLMLLGIGYDLTMYDIGGELPNIETTNTLLTNINLGLQGTAQAYSVKIERNVAFTAVALIVFLLPPSGVPRYVSRGCLFATLAALLAVVALYWKTGGYTAIFPSPFSSYINAYLVLKGEAEEPIRDVQYDGSISTSLQKIVLVVDESVRGDFLSLNDPSTDTTPFLVSQRSRIDNFGIAVSGANCSQESRVAMRYGLQERDYKNDTRKAEGPTFWQFARRAGFETVFIDAYGSVTHLTHGMRTQELALIDRRIIVNDMPQYLRDGQVAAKLLELLSEPRRMFIFIEKFGAHTPYNSSYPPTENVFKAPRDRVFDLEDRTNLRAQYRNTIRWSVDGFFSKVMASAIPQHSLIIYTSDHGQSLSENRTLQSHCSQGAQAVVGEANVPLFAISTDEKWRGLMSQAAAENHDRVSTLDIFPTLLEAMGYAPEWVGEHSEYTLVAPIPHDRRRIFWASGSPRLFDTAR